MRHEAGERRETGHTVESGDQNGGTKERGAEEESAADSEEVAAVGDGHRAGAVEALTSDKVEALAAEEHGGELFFGDETLLEIADGTWGLRALLGFGDDKGEAAGGRGLEAREDHEDGLRLTGIRLTI